jgi:hypothetical protein
LAVDRGDERLSAMADTLGHRWAIAGPSLVHRSPSAPRAPTVTTRTFM